LEIMKMIITLFAPLSGKINFKVVEGTALKQGDIIADMELDDPSQIKRAEVFKGTFPKPKNAHILRPHQVLQQSIQEIKKLLSGYDYPGKLLDQKLNAAIAGLRLISDKNVLIQEFAEKLSIYILPETIKTKINNIIQEALGKKTKIATMVRDISKIFTDYAE